MFFCVKLSAIRAFSTFAFELDFIRSSSFSLSSQPAKAQSLSAVARLHTHESFWNVLGFTHQRHSLHGGVFHWKIMRVCVAQTVDPSFFFLFYALFLLLPNPFAGTTLSEIQPCAWQSAAVMFQGAIWHTFIQARPPSTHRLSLPSCVCATVALPSSTPTALPVEFPPDLLCCCHCCSPIPSILRCGPEVISKRINRGL